MISEKQYVAKGIYRHPQIGHFVSVKNYIFLRNRGKKYLLLRFSNELDYAVDGLSFEVLQYNTDGEEIARARLDLAGLRIRSHEMYSTETAVEVDEKCADFRVIFLEVRSGKYRYRTVDQIVSVYYADGEELFDGEEGLCAAEPVCEYSVTRERFGDMGSVKTVAAMILLILLGLNILNMIFAYRAYISEKEEKISYGEVHEGYTELFAMNLGDGERYAEV